MVSGGIPLFSRYLNTGTLMPNRIFAVNMRMCPFMLSNLLPSIHVYSVLYIDFLLFGQESIFGGITHRQQTGKLILIGRTYYLLDFLHFIGHGDVNTVPSPSFVAARSIFSTAHQAEAK